MRTLKCWDKEWSHEKTFQIGVRIDHTNLLIADLQYYDMIYIKKYIFLYFPSQCTKDEQMACQNAIEGKMVNDVCLCLHIRVLHT